MPVRRASRDDSDVHFSPSPVIPLHRLAMPQLPTESVEEEVVQSKAAKESALRKFLIFVIVMLIPVIGMLVFLNLRQQGPDQRGPDQRGPESNPIQPEAPEGRPADQATRPID